MFFTFPHPEMPLKMQIFPRTEISQLKKVDFYTNNCKFTFLQNRVTTKNQVGQKVGQLKIRFSGQIDTPVFSLSTSPPPPPLSPWTSQTGRKVSPQKSFQGYHSYQNNEGFLECILMYTSSECCNLIQSYQGYHGYHNNQRLVHLPILSQNSGPPHKKIKKKKSYQGYHSYQNNEGL